jgi:REG-2-like HAD superfamily hydrolase
VSPGPRPALRAVTLDATGTLIRAPRLGELYREVFLRHGLVVAADAGEVERLVHRVWQELACRTDGSTDRFSLHPEGARGWWRRFAERVAEHLGARPPTPFATAELYERFARPEAWELYPDALPALERLRERGLALAVVANWDERLPRVLEGLGLGPHLDAVVYSAEVGYEKPDPRPFLAALARLGAPPEAAAHVGDRLREDAEGAAAVGMAAVLLDRRGDRPRPAEPASAVIRSLAELPATLPL